MIRLLKRFFGDGRFLDPALVLKNGNKPTEVFNDLKERMIIDGYTEWNNDVRRGERPKVESFSKNETDYVGYSRTFGNPGGKGSRRDAGKSESKKQFLSKVDSEEIKTFEKSVDWPTVLSDDLLEGELL